MGIMSEKRECIYSDILECTHQYNTDCKECAAGMQADALYKLVEATNKQNKILENIFMAMTAAEGEPVFFKDV